MKQTINQSQFIDAFASVGRADQSQASERSAAFSYEALVALYEYLTERDEETGEETELDPIAICCEWSEYGDSVDWAQDHYGEKGFFEKVESFLSDGGCSVQQIYEGDLCGPFMALLKKETAAIEFKGGILVAAF